MFTGLVETLGTVRDVSSDGTGTLLQIEELTIAADLPLGASVAVNGVCLTVVAADKTSFSFQAGPETLRLTNLGELRRGMKVNLERSLRLGDRLGGHIVQGHADGIARIARRECQADWETVWFTCAPELTKMMIRKGSITVDGISLTLVDVEPDRFSVALIPHTMAITTLGFKQPGDTVNLEIDMFAKYVFKCLEQMSLPPPSPPGERGRG
ncbi:MAG: riboflavin synthase [Gemmataceae bacterium]|nr:riboflavin synthase [Gemmataceae bacterium]